MNFNERENRISIFRWIRYKCSLVKWLIDKGYDVVVVCLDVGEGKDLDVVYSKALDMGAVECHIIDATKEFSDDFVSYAIKGNLMYENSYPLVWLYLVHLSLRN